MLAFAAFAPEPIAAPGDFSIGKLEMTPVDFFPTEGAARQRFATRHASIGLANYHWRIRFSEP
jgi:hypothetical protein